MSSSSKIESFLLAHHEFFIHHLSGIYPLSPGLIEKYKDMLDWRKLIWNEYLPWSTDFFIRFEDHWLWGTKDDDFCISVLYNRKIQWNIQLLDRYSEKIDWEWVSQNKELLLENPGIFDKFKDKLHWKFISGNEYLPWTEQFIEKFKDYWKWYYLSGNRGINWTLVMMEKYKDMFNIDRYRKGNDELWLDRDDPFDLPTPASQKENRLYSGNPVDFARLSFNEETLWTESIIDRYKDQWNWESLSDNKALPWSDELIDRYVDMWEWGHPVYYKEGMDIITGLSLNPALNWSSSLINKYKDRWFWYLLSLNEGIPWSLDIINEFHDLWVWEKLTFNMKLWEKAIYPYLDDDVIDDIMSRIRKKLANTTA